MSHTIAPAPTGRATCRGCGGKIPAHTLRFGERVPNPFTDDGGETTQWYHLACGAYRRPEPLREALAAFPETLADRDTLMHQADLGITYRRLPRVSTASLAPTGRATCRACKAPIDKDTWRIALVYYEDGRFAPSGFIHAGCAAAYLETTDILPRVRHFSPALSEDEMEALAGVLTPASS